MRGKRWTGIAALLALIALLGWAFLKGRKEVGLEAERERPVQASSRVQERNGEVNVLLDEATRELNGFVVATLEASNQRNKVRALGVVLDSQELLDMIQKYAAMKATVTNAETRLAVSRKENERFSNLHDNNLVSDQSLQDAEEARQIDDANAAAAHTSLRALEDTVRQRYGAVIASWLLSSSSRLQRLTRQQDLLVQVTTPSGIPLESASPTVLIEAPDGKHVEASLVSPSPRTDPRIQGASFFYVLPARGSGLLPGMTVVAWLLIGESVAGVIIPGRAAVWLQGKPWVYVESGANQFARRVISAAAPTSDGWFVTSEFSAGDRIVVTGGQQLLSEEFRAHIQVGEEAAGK